MDMSKSRDDVRPLMPDDIPDTVEEAKKLLAVLTEASRVKETIRFDSSTKYSSNNRHKLKEAQLLADADLLDKYGNSRFKDTTNGQLLELCETITQKHPELTAHIKFMFHIDSHEVGTGVQILELEFEPIRDTEIDVVRPKVVEKIPDHIPCNIYIVRGQRRKAIRLMP